MYVATYLYLFFFFRQDNQWGVEEDQLIAMSDLALSISTRR